MPRVARPARDVVVRVPKVLPYTKSSNNARDTTAGTGAVTLDSLPAGSSHHASSSSAVAGPGSGAEIAPVNGHVGGEHRSSGGIGEGRDGGMMNAAGGAGGALPQTQHLMLKAETSAAEWNSLLIWARRQRGPQWDTGTAVWQVDRHSQEYYSFCANPTQNKLVRLNPSAAPSSDARAGPAITTAGAGAGAGSLQPTPTLPSNPSFPAEYEHHPHAHHPHPHPHHLHPHHHQPHPYPHPHQHPHQHQHPHMAGPGEYALDPQAQAHGHGHGPGYGHDGSGYALVGPDGGGGAMVMMGNGNTHGNGNGNGRVLDREDSPPVVGSGRSARLRAGRA